MLHARANAALLLLWAASAAAEDKAMRTLSIGTTGVAVKIRQGPAFDQLFTWSKRLGDRGATHGGADPLPGCGAGAAPEAQLERVHAEIGEFRLPEPGIIVTPVAIGYRANDAAASNDERCDANAHAK